MDVLFLLFTSLLVMILRNVAMPTIVRMEQVIAVWISKTSGSNAALKRVAVLSAVCLILLTTGCRMATVEVTPSWLIASMQACSRWWRGVRGSESVLSGAAIRKWSTLAELVTRRKTTNLISKVKPVLGPLVPHRKDMLGSLSL